MLLLHVVEICLSLAVSFSRHAWRARPNYYDDVVLFPDRTRVMGQTKSKMLLRSLTVRPYLSIYIHSTTPTPQTALIVRYPVSGYGVDDDGTRLGRTPLLIGDEWDKTSVYRYQFSTVRRVQRHCSGRRRQHQRQSSYVRRAARRLPPGS